MATPRPLVMQLLLAVVVCCALAASAGMLNRDIPT
jgi:hypothetical protein